MSYKQNYPLLFLWLIKYEMFKSQDILIYILHYCLNMDVYHRVFLLHIKYLSKLKKDYWQIHLFASAAIFENDLGYPLFRNLFHLR